ncbi:DUF542 domain-containing protein [Sphingobacterium cellulitidis]|uniref:DUF542 domain-containing protein n=1 Tax=Sphingobacterium cellulitidis TaxID=1768011 RepID=UPI003C79E152
MENLKEEKIGDIVAKNFKAAAIFSKYGLDFCCGGQISVEEAAKKEGIAIGQINCRVGRGIGTEIRE